MLSNGFFSVFSALTSLSSIMPSSFSLPVNYSGSNLSAPLYLYPATFVCSLPIHSWADSLLFLHSFLYCSASMIQLWYGSNILLSTVNSPFVVLLFSFSSWVQVPMSNSPSHPSQFFMTGILFRINFVCSGFQYIHHFGLQFNSSTCLSGTSHLNLSFSSTNPPFLCL